MTESKDPDTTPPSPTTREPSPPPTWSRRDFLGGIVRRRKEDRGRMVSESGLAGVWQAVREFLFGYRKLTRDVEEALETRVLFDDRASELPRDLERRGEFWFRDGGEAPSSHAWDPKRLPADLSSEDWEVRETAKAAAMRHGDASLSAALVPLLESERPAVRSAVLEIMGSWRDPHALPFLTRRLKEDPDPATRVRAVLALKELADDRVVEPLLAATLDREKAVRLWAGAALKEWLPRLGQGELRERVEAALTRRQVSPREGLNQGGGGL